MTWMSAAMRLRSSWVVAWVKFFSSLGIRSSHDQPGKSLQVEAT